MTTPEPLTIDTVLSWNIEPVGRTADVLKILSADIESQADGAGRKIAGSTEYFDSDAGNAARTKGAADRGDTFATADVLEKMSVLAASLKTTIGDAIEVIRDKKADAEDSRWDFFVTPEGDVRSHKSNMETATTCAPFGMAAVAIKEATAFNLASSIKGALSAIREADSEGAESFARLLEDLAETVKTQLVATPDDPYLARILSEYQTGSSEGEPRLWPEGWMLTAMRVYDSEFEPKMMTSEEIEALEDLFTEQGPLAAYRQANMVDEARAAATENFPESLDDGHGDAFRHIYWNARMTQEFGEDWTQTYATAHEKSGGNPPNREAMDLFNNQVGREIGAQYPDASPEELQEIIKNRIETGGVLVMAPNGQGSPVITWSNTVSESETTIAPGVDVPLPGQR
jgi:hypothetical protein